MVMAQIRVIEGAGPAEIADWIGVRLALHLAAGQGPVAITVPGGSTPFPIFAELTKQPLEWPRIKVWPGDDRIVPEVHPASNTGRVRSLFEPLGAHVMRRSEEHTSELQSLMRTSYAVFCLKKKKHERKYNCNTVIAYQT